MLSGQGSQRNFFCISALVFAVSAAPVIAGRTFMPDMGSMPMPGGWKMSAIWMRMPGEAWLGAGASFLGMWLAMMIAMMLPSLVPSLLRYRGAVRNTSEKRAGWLTALAGAGYFVVWTALGTVVFPLGAALAEIEMQQPGLARAIPFAAEAIVLIAGALQFTSWKTHRLASCREASGCGLSAEPGAALRYGLRLGLHCSYCCSNLMAILLVFGAMDLRAMLAVTAAISLERLAPSRKRAARAIGVMVIGTGLLLIAQAVLGTAT